MQSLQVLLKDRFAPLGSSCEGAENSAQHTKECEARTPKQEASLKASESNLYDAQQRVHEHEITKGTVDHLARNLDKAVQALSASQEHVRYV